MRTLHVDVVSDFVCPWCFIGIKRLQAAIGSFDDLDVATRYRPYLLDPTTSEEGVDLRSWLQKKYGDPEPMFRRVENVAREVGIPLDFAKVRRSVATVRAHTLVRHADTKGTQTGLATDLFEAYFLHGRDISAMDVLIDLAKKHGFMDGEALTILERPQEQQLTRDQAKSQVDSGVTGVPLTIFGNQLRLSGAQPSAVFRRAIEQVIGE